VNPAEVIIPQARLRQRTPSRGQNLFNKQYFIFVTFPNYCHLYIL